MEALANAIAGLMKLQRFDNFRYSYSFLILFILFDVVYDKINHIFLSFDFPFSCKKTWFSQLPGKDQIKKNEIT